MMDRRRFLQGLWQISAAGLAHASVMNSLGCSSVATTAAHIPLNQANVGPKGLAYICMPANDESSTLRVMDWSSGDFTDYTMPIGYPHSIIQDPRNPNQLYAFEAFGSLAKFDLATGAVTKIDHLRRDSMFDGHGVLTHDANALVCSEYDNSKSTIVTIRDAKTLERLAVAPPECSQAHQVVTLPGTKIVACANLGRNGDSGEAGGAVTFFDYEKHAVVRSVAFPNLVIHLTAISSSEVLAVSRPNTFDREHPFEVSTKKTSVQNLMSIHDNTPASGGPVVYANLAGESKQYWDEPKKSLFNGSFGIVGVPGSKSFLSSHYQSGTIIFWKDSKIEHVFEAPGAMNLAISRDGSEFMALGHAKVSVFSLESRKKLRTLDTGKDVCLVGNFRGAYG